MALPQANPDAQLFPTPSQPIFSDATSFGLLPSNVPMLPITPLESTRPEPYLNDVWNPLSLSNIQPSSFETSSAWPSYESLDDRSTTDNSQIHASGAESVPSSGFDFDLWLRGD